ncbi:GerAB/ArcD/ProY family transporter [Domibacillus epiphyticus]|uniref:Spore gernimation protein KB n=1 Tax=Domibacillus epiphyticus TaxID=1714355 RepID=A0A1V2A601_9BACI|nr:GerAB/ArcD/ProY family transporter [Domibacillus epiphyticus]OMP66360.1 spore gernimation protein KB [Domibacillus epiphyticus]
MEKAKINAYQLFVLIVLFELGSALMVPLAIEAKQDAWLVILIGMGGGLFLYLIYYSLYYYYPDIPSTEYVQKIMGTTLGRIIAFFYVVYFVYLAARVLRNFGEMLVTFAYPETPLFVINALLIVLVIYTVRKGIEVLSRTGEFLFVFMSFLLISASILVVVGGIIDSNNLRPILADGIQPVMKTVLMHNLYFPFGEVVVFTMILPYLNRSEKAKRTGLMAIGLCGLILSLITAVNISVLGVSLVSRSQYPLLSTIQTVEVAGFLERLDVYFVLAVVIGVFVKIAVFFYVAMEGAANLFAVKESARLVVPIGVVILILSIAVASNFSEFFQEEHRFVHFYVHLPFQVIIPIFLLIIAFFKNRKKSKG